MDPRLENLDHEEEAASVIAKTDQVRVMENM